jgi:hypothetical protein
MNKAPKLISHQDAISMLAVRVQKLEGTLHATIKMFEKKIGNHESYVADNIPDCEQYLTLFSDINKRLLDLESLNDRVENLESNVSSNTTNLDPIVPVPAPAKVLISKHAKKKSTVKLTELTDNSPGISFS